MLELKWIPPHELTQEEIKRQRRLIQYCVNRKPGVVERLIQDHGPFPLLWEFNVPAAPTVPFHLCLPVHDHGPDPLPGGVAVLPRVHGQPVSYTGPPWPWVRSGPDALCLMHVAPHPIPILPPPPPLLPPAAPHDGHPRPSHVVDHRPQTRHFLDDVHFPAVRGRTTNPYGAIGSLPTRRNP
ncbi:uncharacterized protein EI90DRAFT_3052490 [Cantharellus anzutake]|uniref:uncharacterized protein n=1 Tax=Cantharellus anzutake TaxID=1750568 RepID=UPI0019065B53|nr:uncharacterized protein EI90DRAFT_3052490 [Cantharellus anzutake]KAF8333592.1 hypothetical protein EI90DRAFT_3052490 [Cantharellus anzutake]